MFKTITQTWNVFVGCLYDCSYCNARRAALTRWKHVDRYKDGFRPHPVESELAKTFKPGEFIFIAYMGDISFASIDEIRIILTRVLKFPDTHFLLCTKNPLCFQRWGLYIPQNVTIATTIETNYRYEISKAPSTLERYMALWKYDHPHKMVSIEPVIDFNLLTLTSWIANIAPEIIEVGADNYHNRLIEPSSEKLNQLLLNLREICPNVIEKDGLARLKGE